MTSNPFDSEHNFWDFKLYQEAEWFKFLVRTLLILLALYLISHWGFRLMDHLGVANLKLDYEYAKLDDRQQQIINRIYFAYPQDSVGRAEESKPATIKNDSAQRALAFIKEQQESPEDAKVITDQWTVPPYDRALKFIDNELNNKIDSIQLLSIRSYLMTAPNLEAISYLSDARFQVRSYFWLTGPAVYFEIVFWSLFGVLASLLFNLGIVARKSTTDENNPKTEFDNTEIPYQVAKLLYAPLCTLVLILGYNFFSDANIADISSSKGVIVFAFISGFYSARVVAFLDRLKEVLLPAGAPLPNTVAEKQQKSGYDQLILEDDKPPLPPAPTDEPETHDPEDEPLDLLHTDSGLPVIRVDQVRLDTKPSLTTKADEHEPKPQLPSLPGDTSDTGNREKEIS